MKLKYIFALAGLLLAGSTLYAQVKISAEVRPRTEYNHGVKTPAFEGQDASVITTQRTRLNLDFKNDDFAIGVVMQDVRQWGAERQLTTNGNNVVYLHQAWAEWFMNKKLSLKAGRQQLVYDDHRILGSVGWAQQARSHDLALLKYQGKINVHLGFAYHNQNLNNNIYTGPDAYKRMQFLWLNRKGDSYSASILFLNNGKTQNLEFANGTVTKQDIICSRTLGTHIKTEISGIKLAGNLYYQFGEEVLKNNFGTPDDKVDLSAFNFSIDAIMGLNEKANIGAGYELLSGTDQSGADKLNSFAPLYGTNHKFNGFMDYFYVGNHGNNVGLNDIYIKGDFKPGKVKFNGAIHFFSADGKLDNFNQGLGTEIDLWCGYSHKGQVQLDFGYSHMFAKDALYAIKGVEENSTGNSWAWVQLTFKPTLFETKKD
ncbi:alginate export family protein [Carboxylicivirga sediminis]|uniref:Alginate export family protein n=1 Tax=Carboxylicivirga sediminis TaxID=2006564 RepID=A0A941IXL9_9BACT|nr:alginate export family protein [Carboxylicivirga sediminis]MBR8536190.1 alginate export family protein [Carboxylicivirga sediminis]